MSNPFKFSSAIALAFALAACGPPPEPEWAPEPTAAPDPAAAPAPEPGPVPADTLPPTADPPLEEPPLDEPLEDPFGEPPAEEPPAGEPPLSTTAEADLSFATFSASQEPLIVPLVGNGEAEVSGTATIAPAPEGETEIAVRLVGEPVERPLAVRLVQGTCAAPQEEIVELYAVEVDAEGVGANTATINVELETLLQAQTALQVLEAEGGAETLLCGDITRAEAEAPAS